MALRNWNKGGHDATGRAGRCRGGGRGAGSSSARRTLRPRRTLRRRRRLRGRRCAHREFDGSPALALSFSLPLDAKADVGPFLQVMEAAAARHPEAARAG